MNGHAGSNHSRNFEENMVLLEEKSLSDVESDAGRADIESRFLSQAAKWSSQARSHVLGGLMRGSTAWRASLLRAGFFLIPSFVQARISRDHRRLSSSRAAAAAPERLGPTAYLDGMRGLAAFFVFFCHYFYTCFHIAGGWGDDGDRFWFLRLPFVRLVYSGPPMVCVFFVISGYALSLKPLRLARARSFATFASTMSSFVFRRGLRLFLPTAISTLMIVLLLRLGLYEWTRDFANDPTYLRNVREPHYGRLPTLHAQLEDWFWAVINFVHVWDWDPFGGSTGLDVHLWTIPVEFRCSMMLFLTLIGTARLRTAIRFLVLAMIMTFTYRSARWEMLLFLSGMALAEIDIIRDAHATSGSSSSPTTAITTTGEANRMLWLALSAVGLYLMSQPDIGSETTPGFVTLCNLIPGWWPPHDRYRYWQSVGAVLFVGAVARGVPRRDWQQVFSHPAAQYLGRISYAVYLVHGPVMHTLGYAFERAVWTHITGVQSEFAYVAGFMIASVFVISSVISAADLFWRAVDAPVVRFSRWLEARCSMPPSAASD
ncbi:acyltransferase [Lasiosphaeria ovina]|uniref:Acyltransferase n=1 Tax=Lasiosphaeria ovina TaxID=92902 RepID=A0AAE0N8H5_9PEZI|nr:acyltransferase [Lasiosphaeria ovina]